MKIKFCACGWRINILTFILDSLAFTIWYFCSVSAIVLVFRLLFNFCNLVFAFSFYNFFEWYFVFRFCNIWYFDFSLTSAIWYFCFVSAIVLVIRLLFSFCNLIFTFSFYNFFFEWYFVFRFCKIWYFDFPSASVIWYFCSVFAIVLVFLLLFSFCNLVFAFSFCNFFWSDILSSASAKSSILTFFQLLQFGISVLSLQLFWYFFFSSVSAIWYLRSVSVIFFGVIFCLPLLQNLVFWLSFSSCNLIFMFCLCNCFGISSSLQFL